MRRWVIAATGVFGLICAGAAMAADPFLGVWKANASKSKVEGTQIASEQITVELAPSGHKWSYDVELKSGKRVHFWLVTDVGAGKVTMYVREGQPVGTGTLKKTGPTSWEVETPQHKSRGSLSADGKTLTVVQTVPNASTIVFDKIK